MRTKRSIKDSLKEYLNWCVGRLLLGGSRDDTVRDMVDAISDEIASVGGGVSQDQLDQTVKDITKSYGIADQTVLTSAESYTDQKIADVVDGVVNEAQQATANANQAAQSANEAATNANQAATSANDAATEAHTQAEYAKTQGDYAKAEGDRVLAEKGQPGGLAELDESGRVLSSQLPSYVDDVINVATYSQLPNPGESSKIYITEDTNLTYRWSGTGYVEISPSLALGTTAETAGRGDWTHEAYNHSLIKDGSNPHKTTFASLPDKPTSLPASDVYPWAKAATKPTYTAAEVGALALDGGGDVAGSINTSGYLTANTLRAKASLYPTVSFVKTNDNSESLLIVAGNNLYYRPIASDTTNKLVYHSGNFNPDGKFNNLYNVNDSDNVTGNGYTLKELGGTVSGPFLKWGTPGHMFEFFSGNHINEIQIRHMSQGVWGNPVIMYHSGNFNPSSKLDKSVWDEAFEIKTVDGVRVISAKLDFLSVAGISAYATGPSSGGGGGGLDIPAYIFPGDPSKLDSSASSTHITSILGTAIDLLDAFNNGRVFISKTVTFNEVQVPSDITYNLLKSIDPDNPTIFQIIMSTVVWGHYIEITIDFENNEYQAISNTINGIIGVNNTGTTN